MTIYHPISDFLYEIFPQAKGAGVEGLVAAIRDFYTHEESIPDVVVKDGVIEVTVNLSKLTGNTSDFQKAVALCEKGDYTRARPILEQLALKDPTNSEVHRVLGQISSDEGDHDAAINHLIDALRWNPKNPFALIMMGNVWARNRDDIDTAMKYFEQALVVDPDDHIAANNIGTNLLQLRKYDEAEKWFDRATRINPSYPNTHFGLSILSEQKGDLSSAFYEAIESLRLNPRRDALAKQSFAQAQSVAGKLIALDKGSEVVDRFARELEESSGKRILLEVDRDIPTAAKLEVAENYERSEHVVRFKPDYPNVQHLQMHELYHLKLVVEARQAKANMLFVSRKKHREAFIRSLEKHAHKLNKLGYGADTLANYLNALHEGITRQVYNAPIDLFIEQAIHDEYPDMRPYQFQSLWALLGEAIHATTDDRIVELSPASVLSKSKIYNLLLAYQFKELYGVDMTAAFKPSAAEKSTADRFYAEFIEYRSDREGGEEFEVVDHWGHDLQLEGYYELVPEASPNRISGSLEDQVSGIEDDPLNQRSNDPERDEDMRTFHEGQKAIGTNMAVVMYMVDALQFFSDKEPAQIKEVALEIALLGTQGISPDKKGYKLHHVPGKTFSGYHLLAYYYVSWKLAIPEMLAQLRLPYDNEWAMAEQMESGKT